MQKYKGIWNCLAILTRALGGNYVNFGVFELYGDPALKVRRAASMLDMARGWLPSLVCLWSLFEQWTRAQASS